MVRFKKLTRGLFVCFFDLLLNSWPIGRWMLGLEHVRPPHTLVVHRSSYVTCHSIWMWHRAIQYRISFAVNQLTQYFWSNSRIPRPFVFLVFLKWDVDAFNCGDLSLPQMLLAGRDVVRFVLTVSGQWLFDEPFCWDDGRSCGEIKRNNKILVILIRIHWLLKFRRYYPRTVTYTFGLHFISHLLCNIPERIKQTFSAAFQARRELQWKKERVNSWVEWSGVKWTGVSERKCFLFSSLISFSYTDFSLKFFLIFSFPFYFFYSSALCAVSVFGWFWSWGASSSLGSSWFRFLLLS